MIGGIRNNEKKLVELKKHFEKNIYEQMNKCLTKHAEYYATIEKCTGALESFNEVQDKAAKEYDSYSQVFMNSMDQKKKITDKDLFVEAHKFCLSISHLIHLLKSVTDAIIALRPLAVAKEDEYLKAFANSFKQFTLFTQENFGTLFSTSLTKSKFIFEVVSMYCDVHRSIQSSASRKSISSECFLQLKIWPRYPPLKII